jgi:hypothetical protein
MELSVIYFKTTAVCLRCSGNTGQLDSAVYYAPIVSNANSRPGSKKSPGGIEQPCEVYTLTGEKDSAIKYITLSYRLKDSTFIRKKTGSCKVLALKNN